EEFGDVCRRTAGRQTARSGFDEAGTWRRRHPDPRRRHHHAVETEEEAFECARRFLSYLPSSVYDLPPTIACTDDPERAEESLMKAVPRSRRQVYKMRPIIDAVVDKDSFFEVSANFGRPVMTGLARLEGRAVLL